ncbi:hypothetical protein [Cedecea davisae]|uniref:hypothetical protein n=1 Tax=Cedecea davisae TaxID=158484 RepID=UPI001D0ABFA3|nr:hypothetical protein [Cedecea davisae]
MLHENFLEKQLRSMLLADGKYDENQAGAAVVQVLEFRRSNLNASTATLIEKAKFYARHNKRPATPERRGPIKKARLPQRQR